MTTQDQQHARELAEKAPLPTKEELDVAIADIEVSNQQYRLAWGVNNEYLTKVLAFLRAIAAGELAVVPATPVAWLRDAGEESISTMSAAITNPVRELWLKANPVQVERYTIPLYAAAPNEIPEGT